MELFKLCSIPVLGCANQSDILRRPITTDQNIAPGTWVELQLGYIPQPTRKVNAVLYTKYEYYSLTSSGPHTRYGYLGKQLHAAGCIVKLEVIQRFFT